MAEDLFLLDRLRNTFSARNVTFTEKKMFGGICFMVGDKMCIGFNKNGLLVRIDPEESAQLVKKKGADFMVHGGKPQSGYLYIQATGYDSDKDLGFWIDKCIDFNPRAKTSKK